VSVNTDKGYVERLCGAKNELLLMCTTLYLNFVAVRPELKRTMIIPNSRFPSIPGSVNYLSGEKLCVKTEMLILHAVALHLEMNVAHMKTLISPFTLAIRAHQRAGFTLPCWSIIGFHC
jgi:hypothetical protein